MDGETEIDGGREGERWRESDGGREMEGEFEGVEGDTAIPETADRVDCQELCSSSHLSRPYNPSCHHTSTSEGNTLHCPHN